MLTTVKAGAYTIRGVSVGGVYTSLHVPEVDCLFDAGIVARTLVGASNVLISHGHADHIGALPAIFGVRGLLGQPKPRLFLPEQIREPVAASFEHLSHIQRYKLDADWVGVKPGDEHQLRRDLWVRVFRTHHTVPSVGYQLFRRVQKLRAEYVGMPGREIAERRSAGQELFQTVEHLELAYATDTLIRVLDTCPSLCTTRVLILECSFIDERKSLEQSRAGCHIHLDELLERADAFENEHLVLMHFSQIASPEEVRHTLARRCPKQLLDRVILFAPETGPWPG
jgi:ribonuclease Z